MKPLVHVEHVLGLHELVTGAGEIGAVLRGVTAFAAEAVSQAAGADIHCALTLRRRKRSTTIAGSSQKALLLDRLGQRLATGPGAEALEVRGPVLLDDAATDTRWPEYNCALAAHGMRSALGVPLELGEPSEAVLSFFAPFPRLFREDVIAVASGFVDVAGGTLRLAIRIESVEQLNVDLKAAMSSRKVIDTACGVIMAQNRCSHYEAFQVLRKASSHRNVKIHSIAAEIISRLSGSSDNTAYFED